MLLLLFRPPWSLADTEGFESTGKSDAYDDRIFALSTILSSVLVYNLAETIRESDISKLSFAVELAQGLYQRYEAGGDKAGSSASSEGSGSGGSSSSSGGGGGAAETGATIDPGSMIWLIQRDFLQVRRAALTPLGCRSKF